MLLHTKPRRFSIATLTKTLADARGAIDLASIMVGVLVIGIIGAVIAATVFAVVPWSQDEAAKQSLGAVQTAQSTGYILEEPNRYYDSAGLTERDLLPETPDIKVGTDGDGTCYVAVATSSTGAKFWVDQSGPDVHDYVVGAVSENCPINIDDLADDSVVDGTDEWPGAIDVPIYTAAPCSADADRYGLAVSTDPAPAADELQNWNYVDRAGGDDIWALDQELGSATMPGASPATATHWLTWQTPGDAPISVDSVRAWIGDKEIDITQTGWSFIAYPDIVVDIMNPGLIRIGDGLNSTARAFNADGTISFDVGGVISSVHFNSTTGDTEVGDDNGNDIACWPAIAPSQLINAGAWGLSTNFSVGGSGGWGQFRSQQVPSMPVLTTPEVEAHAGSGTWSNSWTADTSAGLPVEILLTDGLIITGTVGSFSAGYPVVPVDVISFRSYSLDVNFDDEQTALSLNDLEGAIIAFEANGTVNQVKVSFDLEPNFGGWFTPQGSPYWY